MSIYDLLERIPKKVPAKSAYEHGYDCGIHGPNTVNSHFGIFCSQENANEWERGKKDAENKKPSTP